MSNNETPQKVALIYAGPGVSLAPDDTVEALEKVAIRAGFTVRRFVQQRPRSNDPTLVEQLPGGRTGAELSATVLANAALWLAPGSDGGATTFGGRGIGPIRWRNKNNYATHNLLRAAGYDVLLKKAVRDGLGYVGVCAGAYLAANADNLDLLDTGVMWARNAGERDWEINASPPVLGSPQTAYRWVLLAGPHFDTSVVRDRQLEVVARFDGPPPLGGKPAAVSCQVGAGRVFLCGPHPEAPNDPGWDAGRSSAWRTAPGSVERNHDFLAAWMNAIARRTLEMGAVA